MGLWLGSESFTSIPIILWITVSFIVVQVFIESSNYCGWSDLHQLIILFCPQFGIFFYKSSKLCYSATVCHPSLQIQVACVRHMLKAFSLNLSKIFKCHPPKNNSILKRESLLFFSHN